MVTYESMLFRISRKYERGVIKGKILKPYKIIVEDTSDESDSGFESTSDENQFNNRKSDSSTDTEMTCRDFIRKRKMAQRRIKRWEKDSQVMMLKRKKFLLCKSKQYREDEEDGLQKLIEGEIEKTKDQIVKMKRKKAMKYITEGPQFWRRLMLYCAYAKCCANCDYFENIDDGRRGIIVF